MLRKFVLPFVAVTLLGAPAFAASPDAAAPAKSAQATTAPAQAAATQQQPVAAGAPAKARTVRHARMHVRKGTRHAHRHMRHRRHVATMKARAHAAKRS